MENKTTERWERMKEKEELENAIGKAAVEKKDTVTIPMEYAVEIVKDLEMLREIRAVLNLEYMKPKPKV